MAKYRQELGILRTVVANKDAAINSLAHSLTQRSKQTATMEKDLDLLQHEIGRQSRVSRSRTPGS
ncbi:MAG: hypothetical protein V2I33_26325 [Kangiellaceae bacterium]|jgi:hypothetical protein|nr:hypothetical protein [Kangiellaceae bacterium]